MNVTLAIVLIAVSLAMRSWGRKQYYRSPMLKPRYQKRHLFWLIFSLLVIAGFLLGITLIIASIW